MFENNIVFQTFLFSAKTIFICKYFEKSMIFSQEITKFVKNH